MKRALALAALAMLWTQAAPAAEDPRPAQSREIAARFQKELSGKLMPAMSAGGPVAAITVCNKDAPGIAARLSEETVAKHYPADQATGFAVGDLRGAFAIERLSRTETRP